MGPEALSDPQRMSNALKDLLPDAPREASLLVAGATAGVPEAISGYVRQGMDAHTAVRLAAAALAERTALTPDACTWAAGELAVALGFVAPDKLVTLVRAPGPGIPPTPEPAPTAFAQAAASADEARPMAPGQTLHQFAPPVQRSAGGLRWIVIAVAGLSVVAIAVAVTYALTRPSHQSLSSLGRRQSPGSVTRQHSPASAPPTIAPPGSGPDDVWIAQLASVPVTSSTGYLDAVLARVQEQVPGARVLNSARYASLNSGYWVIYYRGSFANGVQALSYCGARGRGTADQCIGRYLSHSPADHPYQCYPPAVQATGDCYHR